MAFVGYGQVQRTQSVRGLGPAAVGVLLTALMFVAGLMFLWPQRPDAAPIRIYGGNVDEINVDEPLLVERTGYPPFYVVELEDGRFVALIMKVEGRKCPVEWMPNRTFNNKVAWFRDPCLAMTYLPDGTCIYGPCWRHLDQFKVEMHGPFVSVVTERIRGELR